MTRIHILAAFKLFDRVVSTMRYRGLAVTSRDDVIDRRLPYWRYFFPTEDVMVLPCDFTVVCHDSRTRKSIRQSFVNFQANLNEAIEGK
jgi:hypothetical protein